jgi:hypothetical protein
MEKDNKKTFEIVEVRNTNSGAILTENCFGFIDDIIEFYNLNKMDGCYRLQKVKRLDGVSFSVGDTVTLEDETTPFTIESMNYDSKFGIMLYFVGFKVGHPILNGLNHYEEKVKVNVPSEITIDGIEYLLVPKQKK